ncbi:hypothetical protein PCANC_03081 [Puccinia coronata f. sp. avenae]|uniref:Uncharacterized protein n=1 Tax=Puccinia coronata f. sp. avenae TaxID=200324 RepID=A0A2N5T6E9_9BASI|nr:hypothetical protein PCANC_07331 [Puccinia coronata f. sp. avenae]PLW57207.1 hypothetical protein PCANC_03081 [Puccinia coronata f. sp. avenae]
MSSQAQQQESTSWELGLRPPTTSAWPQSLAWIQTSITTPGIHQDITRRFASTSTSSDNQGSDHQKLITHISTRPPKPTFHTVSPKAADIDQACLQKMVQAKLTQLSPHLQHLPIDEVEQELTSSIFNAWQDQGKQLLVLATPSPENAERFNFWNGRFREAVSCLKQQHWRSFLSLTDSTSVFQDFQFTKPQSGVEPLLLGGIELERE